MLAVLGGCATTTFEKSLIFNCTLSCLPLPDHQHCGVSLNINLEIFMCNINIILLSYLMLQNHCFLS